MAKGDKRSRAHLRQIHTKPGPQDARPLPKGIAQQYAERAIVYGLTKQYVEEHLREFPELAIDADTEVWGIEVPAFYPMNLLDPAPVVVLLSGKGGITTKRPLIIDNIMLQLVPPIAMNAPD